MAGPCCTRTINNNCSTSYTHFFFSRFSLFRTPFLVGVRVIALGVGVVGGSCWWVAWMPDWLVWCQGCGVLVLVCMYGHVYGHEYVCCVFVCVCTYEYAYTIYRD